MQLVQNGNGGILQRGGVPPKSKRGHLPLSPSCERHPRGEDALPLQEAARELGEGQAPVPVLVRGRHDQAQHRVRLRGVDVPVPARVRRRERAAQPRRLPATIAHRVRGGCPGGSWAVSPVPGGAGDARAWLRSGVLLRSTRGEGAAAPASQHGATVESARGTPATAARTAAAPTTPSPRSYDARNSASLEDAPVPILDQLPSGALNTGTMEDAPVSILEELRLAGGCPRFHSGPAALRGIGYAATPAATLPPLLPPLRTAFLLFDADGDGYTKKSEKTEGKSI
eukprot:gene11396-biopygen12393